MASEYLSHPEADEEVEEAICWYRRCSETAPKNFISEFSSFVDQIRENPERFHPCYKEYRRCNMKRFPYTIIYRRKDVNIFIIAVMHEKRHPDYWKHRTENEQS